MNIQRSRMGHVLVSAIALSITASIASLAPAAASESEQVSVLSRNIYLGADVAVALELLPNMPGAAQLMWEQIAATDFNRRAPVLARELADLKPDVVALQEATQWVCRSTLFEGTTVVFDFTEQLLEEARSLGTPYVVASHDGAQAYNSGYNIPAIPWLTEITDPQTFQPLFGSDTASCGFTIADALLVRTDIADQVVQVGSGDYQTKYAIVPWLFEIPRGFAWADIRFGETTARFLTTHLESLWDLDVVPVGATQAGELVDITSSWQMPLIVTGDFNMDPRDPRPMGAPNPGGQPDATTGCVPQSESNLQSNPVADCNAYWTMLAAGFVDAGPDSLDTANATWGASALLAGPDLDRLALAGQNPFGYTDRLDYLFVKNGVQVLDTELIGQSWPLGDHLWTCDDPEQLTNAQSAAAVMGVQLGSAVCLPSDHVGLFVSLQLPAASSADFPGTVEESSRAWLWVAGIVALIAIVVVAVIGALRRSRRRQRQAAP